MTTLYKGIPLTLLPQADGWQARIDDLNGITTTLIRYSASAAGRPERAAMVTFKCHACSLSVISTETAVEQSE